MMAFLDERLVGLVTIIAATEDMYVVKENWLAVSAIPVRKSGSGTYQVPLMAPVL